ncbi:serine hydrolase [Sphingomonas japonica]|uniref:Beta-lactamase class A catalytic domain-containing protein n=1 Tax=Sphingomonas japonica TaxID=511662 RepID=A0ABX0U1R7_9SPHN|nr:serine hydrolase [Sphingomonas japonica]NIJ22668.1 hypothetical protein [Sphingomonas japonica]
MRERAMVMAVLAIGCSPLAVRAEPAPAPIRPSQYTPLDTRIADIAAYLGGKGDYATLFADSFRAQIPQPQFDAIAIQLRDGMGAVTRPETVTKTGPWQATVRLGYERGVATLIVVVDPAAPHRVSGLRVTGTEPRGDSIAVLDAEFAKLPGKAGFGIYALTDGPPRAIQAQDGDAAAPIGSAFKLWILAEAARQVQAGERAWSDVVPLGAPSLPSGMTQAWPAGSPMTLHSLATLMIAISDNTATDTLLMALGRDKVGAMAQRLAPDGATATLPILTTREAFQLKTAAQADLAKRWTELSPAERRTALADRAKAFETTPLDAGMFGSAPTAPQVEWFASPADMARTLDWLRREGGEQALAILAVNPATPSIGDVAYVGSKGGSEPGVIAMNWLLRTSDGRWLAVAGNWHDPAAAIDEARFQMLMQRALRLAIAKP